MSEIYDSMANKIGSPAAKVVSFTMKTCYNAMKINDLKEIVEELKDNPVVLEIIKARVIRYVYHNPVAYNIRQQIGTICNMKLINNASISKHQVEKYKDYSETKLLPFISAQKYNDYIKIVIEKCGITRQVTVLNSITRKEEKVPIYTVASSHMARRHS